MSKETLVHLNTNVLIGNTDQRGTAWHYRADLQGQEPNHYAGPVPVEDVRRRLFHWRPSRDRSRWRSRPTSPRQRTLTARDHRRSG